MSDFATLVMTADASGLKQGEAALDSLAAKGAQTEARVTQSLNKTGKSAKDLGGAVGGVVVPFRAATAEADKAASGFARLAPQVQNASYQVGDFFVQIAGGGNATTALAQQMPQLLGAFGVFGALAGAAVAIGGALIPMLFDGADGAEAMAKSIEDLGDKISAYQDLAAMANAGTEEMTARFGDLSDSAREVYEGLAKIAEIEALKAISDTTATLDGQFKALRADLEDIAAAADLGASGADMQRYLSEGLAENYGLTVAQARELAGLLDDMKAGGSLQEQADATKAVSDFLQEAVTNGGDFNAEQVEAAKSAGELALRIMEVAGNSEAAAGAVSGISANLASARAEADALAWAIATLPGANIREMDDGRGSQREGARDLAEWRTDEWLRKRREAEIEARRAQNPRGGRSGGAKRGGGGKADRLDGYERSVADIQSQTTAMLQQADALAKVTAAGGDWERALAVIEEEQKLLNEAQKAGVVITPQVRDGIREMAEGYVSAEETLERMRNATDKGQDAMRDFFGSILDGVDGAKDALAQLLEQIAQVQFAKGAIGLLGQTSWGSGITAGLGDLLSFDGGGYTGGGQRSGGLDGKGGYLAMVHPQETITDHTKGQGAGGVTRIEVVPSALFDVKVSEISDASAARMGSAVRAGVPSQIQQYQLNPRKRQ